MQKKKEEDIEITMEDISPAVLIRNYIFAIQRIQLCNNCDSGVCMDHIAPFQDAVKACKGAGVL